MKDTQTTEYSHNWIFSFSFDLAGAAIYHFNYGQIC